VISGPDTPETINEPPEDSINDSDLAGEPEDAQHAEAVGNEPRVPERSGDTLQSNDAVGYLGTRGGVQHRGVKAEAKVSVAGG
jgi:hypothetical protein